MLLCEVNMRKEKVEKLHNALIEKYHCEFYSVFPPNSSEYCYLCNTEITGKYYRFSRETSEGKKDIFYTGETCGKDIFKITGQNPPKFFDIEDEIKELAKIINKVSYNINNSNKVSPDEIKNRIIQPAENAECILAISLLFYVKIIDKTGYLNDVKQQFENNYNRKLTEKISIALNNFAHNFCDRHKCSTIRNYIKTIAPNKNVHKNQLPLLEKFLKKKNETCYF